jgi:hypothetical protein
MKKENAAKEAKYLKHYTSLSNLKKILGRGYLLLGSAESWEDRNDAASVEAFCRLKGQGIEARVICLAEDEEVITHWKTYASKGCCIQFNTGVLLNYLEKLGTDFLHDFVDYKPMEELTAGFLGKLPLDKFPFLKRRAYECEREYRVVWFGKKREVKNARIPLEKGIVAYITLAPDLPNREKIQKSLEKKYGIEVKLSRITKNDDWIARFRNAKRKNTFSLTNNRKRSI